MYYLEDLKEGLVIELGTVRGTTEQIVAFAKEYDPQQFHLDEEVAGRMFGGIIASGWHTASLTSRLVVDGF